MFKAKTFKICATLAAGIVVAAVGATVCQTSLTTNAETASELVISNNYVINEVSAGNVRMLENKLSTKFYFSGNYSVEVSSFPFTYSVKGDDAAFDRALELALQKNNMTLSVSGSSPAITIDSNYQKGYYQIVATIDIVDVSFRVQEQANADIWRSWDSGRNGVVKEDSLNFKVYFYETASQTYPVAKYPIEAFYDDNMGE